MTFDARAEARAMFEEMQDYAVGDEVPEAEVAEEALQRAFDAGRLAGLKRAEEIARGLIAAATSIRPGYIYVPTENLIADAIAREQTPGGSR